MKMTLVVDTDDREGINDALKMIRIMQEKYSGNVTYHKESFGKIEFIKMLRKFGKRAVENYKTDEEFELEDIASLRFTKTFADEIWRDKDV